MGIRAVALDGLMLFFTGLSGFLYLSILGLNILTFSLGVLSGLVSGLAMGLTFTRGLEETGEVRVSYQTLSSFLLILGGVLLIFIGFLLALGGNTRIQSVNFLWPAASFLLLGRITVFLRWESKHKSHIIFGYNAYGLLRRIYTTS
jgi:uncharacterized membrane-anchored protein